MPIGATRAAQDYLKGICLLEDEAEAAGRRATLVSTKAIAERLDVSAASATNMLKKLDSLGLVKHLPYRGAELTNAGRKIALEVIRHHRLLETYLAEALGVPWDEVHDEAEVLEHVLSERLEDRIAKVLGEPTEDPHGHPIPPRDGDIARSSGVAITDLAVGAAATVAEVSDRDPELLRYLGDMGIYPGVRIRLVAVGPFGGPLTVAVAEGERQLGRDAAFNVLVDVDVGAPSEAS
ncbi:MAG: metal-dependent transcriptional regulator [Actinomycetota bacterium]